MIRRITICPIAALLFIATSCSVSRPGGLVVESYLSDEASVGFDIEPVPGTNDTTRWLATYRSQGKVARFRIELGTAKAAEGPKDFELKFGEGIFVAEAASDASVLLSDLQKALGAKAPPKPAPRTSNLRFTFANLGENLSQGSSGGFNAKPAGGWSCTKIFIGEGDQEGELFLNLNPTIRKGQFSMKDPDYGDLVLTELAKVL